MKLHAVESNSQMLDGGSMFGNCPKAMWQKWIKPNEQNLIPLATRALLVQLEDGRNFLFEVGLGGCFDEKLRSRYGVAEEKHMLLENLKKLNLKESEIDGVILSHLHFDHAGGMLPQHGDDIPPHLLFPNATIYVSKKHWQSARSPHPRERASYIPILYELLEASNRLELVEEESHPDLNFGVKFRYSDGHTVGMMMSEIETENGPLVFVTDLIPGMAWVHLPITMGYDRFPEEKIDEKRELLEWVIKENGRLFFTHDPNVICAEIKKDEKGRYQGVEVQL